MQRLDLIATNLSLGEDGIWYGHEQSRLSYPADGNELCYQVEDDSFWFRHRNRCILQVLRRYPPTGTLFDVGGGNGFVSLGLQRAGIGTVLVEPGKEGARNAARRGLHTVICATMEDAGFLPGSLPAIGMFDVLEHVENDLAFLESLHDLLIPDGRIYLAVPAFAFLWSAEDAAAGHFRRYTIGTLTKALDSSGFTVDYSTYFFQWLWLPIFLFRTVPSFIGLRPPSSFIEPRNEHRGPQGLVKRLWDALMEREARAIARGHRIAFGSSCLVVAHR